MCGGRKRKQCPTCYKSVESLQPFLSKKLLHLQLCYHNSISHRNFNTLFYTLSSRGFPVTNAVVQQLARKQLLPFSRFRSIKEQTRLKLILAYLPQTTPSVFWPLPGKHPQDNPWSGTRYCRIRPTRGGGSVGCKYQETTCVARPVLTWQRVRNKPAGYNLLLFRTRLQLRVQVLT